MKYLLLLTSLTVSGFVFGQNQKIEDELAHHLRMIHYWKFNGKENDVHNEDSLYKEGSLFKSKMQEYTSKYPETITNNFDKLINEGLMIASSDDGLFRIYSWDTETGGTMHYYDNIYQYRSGGKVYCKTVKKDTLGEGPDPLSWYSVIYTFKPSDKTYYLGVSNADYSTQDKAQKIKFFTIEGSSLNDTVHLAKTKEGIMNELSVNYVPFPDVNHEAIAFDIGKKTIRVYITEDKYSMVTDKFTAYKFTGKYFEEVK